MSARFPIPIFALTGLGLTSLALAACASSGPRTSEPPMARAEMIDTSGEPVGTLTLTSIPGEGRVHVQGSLTVPSLDPGPRGFHIHAEGVCEPPSFESAGDHFDPNDAPHGGPGEPADSAHAGDMGNVNAGLDGTVEVDRVVRVAERGDDSTIVLGRTIVLHSGQDDLVSQPSGDSGDPAACGVIVAVDSM